MMKQVFRKTIARPVLSFSTNTFVVAVLLASDAKMYTEAKCWGDGYTISATITASVKWD